MPVIVNTILQLSQENCIKVQHLWFALDTHLEIVGAESWTSFFKVEGHVLASQLMPLDAFVVLSPFINARVVCRDETNGNKCHMLFGVLEVLVLEYVVMTHIVHEL